MNLITVTNPITKEINQYDLDKILSRLDMLEKSLVKPSKTPKEILQDKYEEKFGEKPPADLTKAEIKEKLEV